MDLEDIIYLCIGENLLIQSIHNKVPDLELNGRELNEDVAFNSIPKKYLHMEVMTILATTDRRINIVLE